MRLRPEELGPGGTAPSWRRAEARTPEQAPDRRRSHPDTELAQLTLHAHAAPARVLPGQPDDELPHVLIEWWSTGPAHPAVRPLPPHELPVPAQERRRRHDERDPAFARDRSARHREEHPVHGPEPRRAAPSLEDPELVAEDQDLEVFGGIIAAADPEESGQRPNDQAEDEQHLRILRCVLIVNRGFRPPRGRTRREPSRLEAVFCYVSAPLRHPGQFLIALLAMVGLLGCASLAGPAAPRSSAIPSAIPSAQLARYDDGLPRVFDGQPVLRGKAAFAHEATATDARPFLLGGWVTNVPGAVISCPAMPATGAAVWLAPCGQPTFSDLAGDPNPSLVAGGELTFHFADVSTLQSGPVILRVHVHDPRAAQCGTQEAASARAMVVEAVVWGGDAATAPRPLDLALVSAARVRVAPSATLTPLGNGVAIADCGAVLATTRDYVVPVRVQQIPVVSLVEIAPSPEALARALPIPSGTSGALTPGALLAVVRSPGGFGCRWLRLDNVALLVRTSDPQPTSGDRAFLDRLVAALDATVRGPAPPP